MIDGIRRRLRLTTLKYQRIEDLVAAIGLPKEKLCTHCWDGSSYRRTAGYGALRRSIDNEVSPLWEWLPAFVAKATSAE